MFLVVPSNDSTAPLQSVIPNHRGVDEFMTQLADALPAAATAGSKAQSMPLLLQTRLAEDQRIHLALADKGLDDSLHAIANDILGSMLR